jgi:hypothetical protein
LSGSTGHFGREVFGGVCSHREIDRITEAASYARAYQQESGREPAAAAH